MNYSEAIKMSRATELVDDDKFETHFELAKENDVESRKQIFTKQCEHTQVTRL